MTDTKVFPGGPAIPDVYMSTTDGKTIRGNGTTEHPLEVVPGTTGAGLSVVLRPGGVAAGNVAATLPEAVALLSQIQGERILQFDDSVQSPVVVPPGSLPMAGVVWASYPGRSAQVSVSEGASISGLRTLRGVRVVFTGTTPPVTDLGAPGAPGATLVLEDGASVSASGAGPFVRLSHNAVIDIGEASGILLASSPVVDAGSSVLRVFADGPFAALRGNTVSGAAGAFLFLQIADSAAGDGNGDLSTVQPAFLGSITALNATRARSYPTDVRTAATVLDVASLTVRADPTAGEFLVFLPPALPLEGQDVDVKNVSNNAANAVIIVANSAAHDDIDGAVNFHLTGARAAVKLRSDGAHQWMVMSTYP